MNQKRRQQREVYKDNLEVEESQRANMEWQFGQLLVDKEPYQPDPAEVLYIPKAQIDEDFNLKLDAGGKIVTGGNTFIAYGIAVTIHQQVKKAYLKLHLMHTAARHIMCAYNLPYAKPHIASGYCDDQDLGSRQLIKNLMKRCN